MFEVKVTIPVGFNGVINHVTSTIATFDWRGLVGGLPRVSIAQARSNAIKFAKQINPEFEVQVINVEDEDNREKAFGLVWAHVPGDASVNEFGLIEPTI